MANFPNRDAARRRLLATVQPAGNSEFVALRIDGEITDIMADRVTRQLSASPKASTVTLIVNSPGGDLRAARRIYGAVRRHKAKRKIAHGLHEVSSAAALVYTAGDVRRLEPGTRVLLHGAAAEPSRHAARWTRQTYEDHAATLAALDDVVATTLAERCGTSLAVIKAELATEKDMPLQKALSIGLVHEVVGVSPPLSKAWPATARAAMAGTRQFTAGANAHKYGAGYLAACAIGGK